MSLIYPYRSHALRNDYPADEEDLPKFSVDSFSRHLSPLKSLSPEHLAVVLQIVQCGKEMIYDYMIIYYIL